MAVSILISDDEPTIVEVYRRGLERYGYQVLSVPGGGTDDTLLICRERPPDLLITDLLKSAASGAGGYDGVRLCRELRSDERTRAISIMVVTGAGPGTLLPGIWEDPLADAYLTKPLSFSALYRGVRDTLTASRLGLRLHPITALPPWQVLEIGLRRLARQGRWALLHVTFRYASSVAPEYLAQFATVLQSEFGGFSEHLYLAHDLTDEGLLIAGVPPFVAPIARWVQARAEFGAGRAPAPLRADLLSGPPGAAPRVRDLLARW